MKADTSGYFEEDILEDDFREQRVKRTCKHVHLTTAAKVNNYAASCEVVGLADALERNRFFMIPISH